MSRLLADLVLLPRPRQIRNAQGAFPANPVTRRLEKGSLPAQGYRLRVGAAGVELIGADPAGLFYADATLSQLLRQSPRMLPAGEIEDWPDYPVRGVMLDISRDKVPTMRTL